MAAAGAAGCALFDGDCRSSSPSLLPARRVFVCANQLGRPAAPKEAGLQQQQTHTTVLSSVCFMDSGVEGLLEQLEANGIVLGVLSNAAGQYAAGVLAETGVGGIASQPARISQLRKCIRPPRNRFEQTSRHVLPPYAGSTVMSIGVHRWRGVSRWWRAGIKLRPRSQRQTASPRSDMR